MFEVIIAVRITDLVMGKNPTKQKCGFKHSTKLVEDTE